MALKGMRERVMDRLFGDLISERVYNAVQLVDDEYWTQIGGAGRTLDEDWYQHRENLDDALDAWRTNPLARRIVALCTQYVIGGGITLTSSAEWVQKFVDEFWRLNGMAERLQDWCDELTRSGELFIAMASDAVSGATFVRLVPAVWIDQVDTDPEDYGRELRYHQCPAPGSGGGDLEGRWWPSAREDTAQVDQVMLHVAINRPVGCVRGSSDLSPLLPWLARYRDWLENRVRLNKYKTAFLWDVTVQGRPGQADSLRKKKFRYKQAPDPGSIVVHDDSETWQAVAPHLEAWDAKEDGLALRLMIAAGAGVPLHFLAEGSSATRATAQEMGDPTYRHYARRQLLFSGMLIELVTQCVRRANARGRGWRYTDLALVASVPDITKHDNLVLAQAAAQIARALESYAAMGLIDKQTALELAMKFAGEVVDVDLVKQRIEKDGAMPPPAQPAGWGAGRPAGAMTGERERPEPAGSSDDGSAE
jgi:hypothetical protein